MSRKHRTIAILLVICLCFFTVPERVYAQETEGMPAENAGEQEDILAGDPAIEETQQPEHQAEQTDATPADALEEEEAETEDTQSGDAQPSDTQPQAGQLREAGAEDAEPSTLEDDDPGQGRLQGDAPAEFYDAAGKMRTMATAIQHNSKFAGYDIINGIDVSKWDGVINWKSVKKAGIDFAFVRTSYRGYEKGTLATDPYAASNLKNAAAAGVKTGAYIFSQAITVKEAQQEADYLLNSVKGYNITLPLVLDFEYFEGGRLDKAKLSKRAKTNICLAFCERVKAAGYTPLVYANKTMLTNDLYASEISSQYPVWLAHYTASTNYTGDYNFWQYTEKGKVSGITGDVDMNFWYVEPTTSNPSAGSTDAEDVSSTTLSGKASSYDKAVLTWKKVSGAAGYEVYRYNSSAGSYEKIKTIKSAGTTSYTDTGRTMATTYKYRVKVYKNVDGKTVYSRASNTVSVKTDPTMTGKTNWIRVNVRKGPDTSKAKLKVLGINTGVTITGISGSWYRISLKVNGKKTTGYIKKTYITIIRKPTLTVSAASSSKVKLTWNKISGASGYEIQRYNTSKKRYVTIKTIGKGATVSYTNSGLKGKTTYKYRIRSYRTVRGRKIYSYYCSAKSVVTK